MSTEVRFPSKMTVESPKTDALIDAQIAAFSALSRNLETGFSNLLLGMKTLERMPDLLLRFQAQIESQLSTIFTHQLEAGILSRHAALLSLRRTATAIEGLLREKTEQLTPDRERIIARYQELLGKVATQCEDRIRELDSHALQLLEDVYPTQVQRYFSRVSTPVVGLIADHQGKAAAERRAILQRALVEAREQLASLRNLAQEHERTVAACSSASSHAAGWYAFDALALTVARGDTPGTGDSSEPLVLAGFPATSPPSFRELVRALPGGCRAPVELSERDIAAIRDVLRARGRSDIADALA